MQNKIALVVLVFISISGWAENGKIKQIFKDQKRIVVEYAQPPTDVFVDNQVSVTGNGGESCVGTVASKAGKKIVADFSSCSDFNEIMKAGREVEKSDLPVVDAEAEEPESNKPSFNEKAAGRQERAQKASSPSGPRDIKFGVGLYYNSAEEIIFDEAKGTDSGLQFDTDVTYNTTGAMGINAEITMSDAYSWGFNSGINYEGERKIKSAKIDFSGLSVSASIANTSFHVGTIYGNAIYRWDMLYLPFGLNYSFVSFKNAPLALEDASGGIGVAVGLGCYFSEVIAGEFNIRSVGITGKKVSSGGDSLELGRGSLTGMTFGIKAFF